MKKKPAKKTSKASNRFPDLKITLPYQFTARQNLFIMIGGALLSIIAGLMYVLPMKSVIGVFGFPLDDPWIHLNFARNLADLGSYSYFKNEMATSGSTSPLYTFFAAMLWKISHDEFFASYTLGILFLALSSFYLYKLSLVFFEKEHWLAIGATAAFILTGRIDAIAVSGMETTLFICILLATLYYYLTNKQILFAVFTALLLWARPDGLIMIGAIAVHFLYRNYIEKGDKIFEKGKSSISLKSFFTPGIILFILVAGYVLFNQALSGSFFPNTFVAKLKYYGGGSKPEYLTDALKFYSSSVLGVFIAFFSVAFISMLVNLVRRKKIECFIPILFVIGMIVAYWIELPFLFQDGRYLIPTIPFFIVAGVWGMREFFQWLLLFLPSSFIKKFGNVFTVSLIILALIIGAAKWNSRRKDYYDVCRYIYDRQVTTAHWIKQNTAESSIIATHDIGAIGFYSDRRIVDMVGLVSPQMIENIGDLKKLTEFIKSQHTTHIAVLRNWFEVVNQNPIFMTNEKSPEIMEVFEFRPGVTHIMPQLASTLNSQAAQLLQSGRFNEAIKYLQESYRLDPNSVRTVALSGIAATTIGDTSNAVKAFQTALNLQPDYVRAMVPYGKLLTMRKKYSEAINLLQQAMSLNPQYTEARDALREALINRRDDSLAALGYKREHIEIPVQ